MSSSEPQTRHRVYPPQRMHTRSRSNIGTENVPASVTVKSDSNAKPQPTPKGEKGSDLDTSGRHSTQFTCNACGNFYKTLGGLRRHQVAHIKKKSWSSGDVHKGEITPEFPVEFPHQIDRLHDLQDNSNISNTKESVTQKQLDKNFVSEFQLNQQSNEKTSQTENLAQLEEETEEVCPANQEIIPVEGKTNLLLEQVVENSLVADDSQSSEIIVQDLEPSHSASTHDPIGKNQDLTNIIRTEKEAIVTVENGSVITDLLLQGDDFEVPNSSNSEREKPKSASLNIKPGTSLLTPASLEMVKLRNTDKLVNFSKESATSGQTINTATQSHMTSGQNVNASVLSNMTCIQTVNSNVYCNGTSGISTIGQLKTSQSLPNQLGEESAKLAQLSDKHVSIKSHFSKEDIDKEVTDDPVLGLVSGLVKFCPDLSETDYTEVAKVTGVTVIMLDKQKIVVHGSWKALNRAYTMIENLQVAAKERECVEVSSAMECVEANSSIVECIEVNSPVECVTVASPLDCNEDQLKRNGIETSVMAADDSYPDVAIETSDSVDLDNLTPISMMEPDTFMCDKCSKLFWSRRSLQEHIALRHSEHKCKVCNKVFSERRYLQTHLKRHANVRNYTCSICGWRFMERFKMKLHMESHKEQKDRHLPYKCSMCGNQFYNRASWSDHLNTHTGNRPYSCMLCSSTFAHRIGLKRHMVTHLKEKPYKCGHCDRSFSFRSKLSDHITMHTGIGKHRCTHCGRIFTASSSLRRHMEQCTTTPAKPPAKPPAPKVSETSTTIMIEDVSQAKDTDTIYMCGICAETFDSLSKAEKHTIDHEQGVTTVGDDAIVLEDNHQLVFTDNVAIISEQHSQTAVSDPPS